MPGMCGCHLRRAPQPFQDGLLRDAQDKADAPQLDFTQQPLEYEDDFFFRRAQIKEDRAVGLRELFLAQLTMKDTPLTTLGLIGRNGSPVAAVHQAIRAASWRGARVTPVFGFSQGSALCSVWSRNRNYSWGTGPFLFQSISG
jgi:hypothetical protein